MRNSNKFINIYFDRYLDEVMSKPIPRDMQHMLSREDLYSITDKDRWIPNASLEEKLLMLSRLGHPFALTIGGPQKSPTRLQMEKIVTVFFRALSFKRRDAVTMLRDKFLFIIGDMDFIKGLKLAANVFNSPAAATFSGYSHIADKVYKYKAEAQKQFMRDTAAGHDIDGIIINSLNLALLLSAQEGFKNLHGISERQYQVLAILSKYRECSIGDLNRLTGGMRWIPSHTKALIDMRMIEKKSVVPSTGAKDEDHYWITGTGEQVLLKARNYFIQHL